MSGMVSNAVITMIIINLALGFLIPAILCIVVRKKSGGSLKAFFVGCGTMFLFAFVLEGIINSIVASVFGAALSGNIWLYGLYGGFMAGLFEETGRFAAFKTVLKKNRDNNGNALMYGAGHGGFEAFYLLVIGMLNNLIYAVIINAGMTDMLTAGLKGEQAAAVESVIEQLSEASPLLFLAGPVERLSAILLHISLSVLVWFAAKQGGKYILLYPLSVLIHLLVDAVTVIVNSYVSNVWIVEGLVFIMAGACAVLARFIWKKQTA